MFVHHGASRARGYSCHAVSSRRNGETIIMHAALVVAIRDELSGQQRMLKKGASLAADDGDDATSRSPRRCPAQAGANSPGRVTRLAQVCGASMASTSNRDIETPLLSTSISAVSENTALSERSAVPAVAARSRPLNKKCGGDPRRPPLVAHPRCVSLSRASLSAWRQMPSLDIDGRRERGNGLESRATAEHGVESCRRRRSARVVKGTLAFSSMRSPA